MKKNFLSHRGGAKNGMEARGQKHNLKNNWSLHADEKKEQGEALMKKLS